jgi:hypothetical protein
MERALTFIVLGTLALAAPASAQPACTRADFEAVVDTAAAALRELNQKHKPAFQEKLRFLKEKRGWSHDQFLKEAAPLVRDDEIAAYERTSEELLDAISHLGQEGSAAKSPDCGMLVELQEHMKRLVATQMAKWDYMFAKVETELWK